MTGLSEASNEAGMKEQIANPMRVIIYGEYFLPIVGGVQSAMHLLAKGLMQLDSSLPGNQPSVEVTVVTPTQAQGWDDAGQVYRVIRRPSLWRLMKLLRGADLVHIAGPCLWPTILSKLFGKRVVIEHHGYQSVCPNGLLFEEPSRTVCPGYFIKRKYGECIRCSAATMSLMSAIRSVLLTFPRLWLSKRVSANITISDHVAGRLNLPRSRTIYYGIEDVAIATANARLPVPLEIAYVGRLVVEKGPAVLLQAARLLRDSGLSFRLTFVGDGPERENLAQLTGKLNLNDLVTFTGDLRGRILDDALERVNIMAMPSLCEETAGLAAIEQMMRGKTVVVSDIGGLGEVVGNAGMKFTPGDAMGLARCIRTIVDDRALAARLGSAARDRALQLFRQESMARAHLALYREASSGA